MGPPTSLEEPYRSRAVPPGSARHLSWLFAARECREPLLGIYALLAEWRALADPATERGVAQVKLAWWRDEIERLIAGRPVHPISRHLAAQPHAAQTDFSALQRAVQATGAQIAGAPIERTSELAEHCRALCGEPWLLAPALAGPGEDALADAARDADRRQLERCAAALASAEYLESATIGYRREAHAGRVAFPVEELLAAGIEDAALAAAEAPAAVQSYLAEVRQRAGALFRESAQAASQLPPRTRERHRHLAVLAQLGARRMQGGPAASTARAAGTARAARFALGDLYAAWRAARGGTRITTTERG